MPGDAKTCRDYAVRCAQIAAETKEPRLKERFTQLAGTWLDLALEIERSHALWDELSESVVENAVGPRGAAAQGS
jgi:hypothetical protein